MPNISDILAAALPEFGKAVFSQPTDKAAAQKLSVRPLAIRGETVYQAESIRDNKAMHQNLSAEELTELCRSELEGRYRQVLIVSSGESRQYILRRDGSYKLTGKTAATAPAPAAHNREKKYLLAEGECIPALVDLGVFTADYKILRDKYDKYKQINRFIELIDDAVGSSGLEEMTILDFGCGKSYLTFILYYYLVEKRGMRAHIIGYDLKADVVERCNGIAAKYGYSGLEFHVADVTRDTLYDRHIDMVVTLHACDIATDYALHYALQHDVKYIFSVPCCQHEINAQIKKGRRTGHFPAPRDNKGAHVRAADRLHPRRGAGGHGLRGGHDRVHRLCPLAEEHHAPLHPQARAISPRHSAHRRGAGACRALRLQADAAGADKA